MRKERCRRRNIYILIVSLFIMCQSDAHTVYPVKNDTKSDNEHVEEQKSAKALERIASAQEAIVNQKDEKESEERSTRDLAAQESMAKWASWSFWVALIGALFSAGGLLALLYTLRLNRLATNAAQDAVAVARDTNQAQSRPWLSVECTLESPKLSKMAIGVDGIYFNLMCRVKNHGRSPATGVSFHAEMVLLRPNSPSHIELMNRYCDDIRARSNYDAEAIFPESTAVHQHTVVLRVPDIEENILEKDFKYIAPIVYGCINYQSPYTSGVRQTRFVYHVSTANEEGYASVIQPAEPNWLDKPIALIRPCTVVAD